MKKKKDKDMFTLHTPTTEEIKMAIRELSAEANSPLNAEWVREAYKARLKEIAKTILEVLDK